MLKCKSFTLIELLVVISIIAILVALIFPHYSDYRKKARDTRRMEDIRAIQTALVMYKQKYGEYPSLMTSNSCESSLGNCSSCPCCNPCTGNEDWSPTGVLYQNLVEKDLISLLPKDPLNNSEYYYRYMPAKNKDDSDNSILCYDPSPCYYYLLKIKLEKGGSYELKGY